MTRSHEENWLGLVLFRVISSVSKKLENLELKIGNGVRPAAFVAFNINFLRDDSLHMCGFEC